MYLRTVRVTLNEGKFDEYWAWAKEIVSLWDSAGVIRAGGPYAFKDESGQDTALWITVHENEAGTAELFKTLYATGEGARLIALRPPLVKETTGGVWHHWDRTQPAPAPPDLS